MFLAAVGQPTQDFDGSVGIWPVQKMHHPKRATRDRPRVNGLLSPYMKTCTMDGDVFFDMIKTLLLPRIIQLGVNFLQRQPVGSLLTVYAQLDNAGGHGLNDTLDKINKLGYLSHRYIRIHFHRQPPNSPDLNVLDLGA